jgi:hypothetical protein
VKGKSMTTLTVQRDKAKLPLKVSARFGFYLSVLTVMITVVTFGVAMTALPNSGAGCAADCFTYPYLDSLSQYPQDYYWMPLAIILTLVYLALMAVIHASEAESRKVFSLIGLTLAISATIILVADYYVQFAVIPVSLMNGEIEGITLLTQYNPHGVFIVLEELGYVLMSLSFLAIAPVFARSSRLEGAIQWVFIVSFALMLLSFIGIMYGFGLNRLDRFEIAAISIDWLTLIINGVLLAISFRRQMESAAA